MLKPVEVALCSSWNEMICKHIHVFLVHLLRVS